MGLRHRYSELTQIVLDLKKELEIGSFRTFYETIKFDSLNHTKKGGIKMAKIRISAAGFKAGPIKTFGDFADHCIQLVNQAKSDTPDFLVFPELFTTELMNFFEESDLLAKFAKLATYTDDYRTLFKELAKKNGFYIIAGSHLKEVDGKKFNTSHIFTPGGEVW
jgi:predicted amidohydrolase